jgi:hypothetical protein
MEFSPEMTDIHRDLQQVIANEFHLINGVVERWTRELLSV